MKTKHMITLSMALLSTSFLSAWEINTHRAIDRCAITKECGRDGAKNLAWFGDTMIAYREEYAYEDYEGYIAENWYGKDLYTYNYFYYASNGPGFNKWRQTFSDYKYINLIEAGTILEDSVWNGVLESTPADVASGRYSNHFMDPQNGNKKLLGASENLISWATEHKDNYYSYNKFLEYYKKGFTEANSTIRKTNRANMFVSVGFLLHLLNDVNVPAHVRDDGHPFGDPFETWMRGGEWGYDNGGFRINGNLIEHNIYYDNIKTFIKGEDIRKEATFKDFYQREAKFTSLHFFSEDTILHKSHVPKDVSITDDKDEDIVKNYILSNVLDTNKILAIRVEWKIPKEEKIEYHMRLGGDNSVLEDNGKHLIPRAVANAEGFVNFLFRGRMKADIVDNSKLYIENFSDPSLVAKDNTDFNNGTFSIYYDTNRFEKAFKNG